MTKAILSATLLLVAFALSGCEEQLDMDYNNLTQKELNREKYAGIEQEFCSGNLKDWEHHLWGNGLDILAPMPTCFNFEFAKCDNLFGTVPMYKYVEVSANGGECELTDMLCLRYEDEIWLKRVTFQTSTDRTSISSAEFAEQWSKAYGSFSQVDRETIKYFFPPNPSFSPRLIYLEVSRSRQYPSESDPEEMYVPVYTLQFMQLGNNNHNTTQN